MKTRTTLTDRIWRGTVVSTSISYLGDLKHYTINFKSGSVHLFTKDSLGVCMGDIITFTVSIHGSIFIANNVKVVGKKNKPTQLTRMQMTAIRSKGY